MRIGKKRIAILGGAFDPIHLDHIQLAKDCLNHDFAEEVWVTPSSSHRWDKETYFSSDDRMKFVQEALEGLPNILPCFLEVEWGQYRGSYHFLKRLQCLYPNHEFYLLMGADTYQGILQWRDPLAEGEGLTNGLQLIQEFPLVLFARQGFEFPNMEKHRHLGGQPWQSLILDSKLGSLSSTQVRGGLNRGETIKGLVPESIVDLVEKTYRS
jgi:nicotinate-nucleotide adenylyltransferase